MIGRVRLGYLALLWFTARTTSGGGRGLKQCGEREVLDLPPRIGRTAQNAGARALYRVGSALPYIISRRRLRVGKARRWRSRAQTIEYNADLLFGRAVLPSCPPDVANKRLGSPRRGVGFLSHLCSVRAPMSQKSPFLKPSVLSHKC